MSSSPGSSALSGTTFAIQGYGNVGSHTARCLAQMGGKIIGVSDAYGAVVNSEGIDIAELDRHVAKSNKIVGFKGGDATTNEQLLTMAVDVLIPAALGGVFDRELAKSVAAQVIVEAANSPTWPEADEIFKARGIPVVPDVLANAGGVIVSYFEWVQNLQHFRWPLEQIQREQEQKLVDAFREVYDLAQRRRHDAPHRSLHESHLAGRPSPNPGRHVSSSRNRADFRVFASAGSHTNRCSSRPRSPQARCFHRPRPPTCFNLLGLRLPCIFARRPLAIGELSHRFRHL